MSDITKNAYVLPDDKSTFQMSTRTENFKAVAFN